TVGDELVEPGRALSPGRTHDADAHALAAAVREAGATAVRVGPVGDDRAALREVLADQLVRADLLLLTGGLSDGPWDTVTDVLAPLGTVRFDQVAMAPGRRQGFGTVLPSDEEALWPESAGGTSALRERARVDGDVADGDVPDEDVQGGVPVFALPGHPVEAVISFEVFVRPALRAMAGQSELFRPSVRAAAARSWASTRGLRQFVPARVTGSPTDGYVVTPVGDPADPALTDLADANALAVVGEDTTVVRAGDRLACLVLEG
ncbi:hypothetical protein ICW40_19650, partial [Actinotalea ferrariae]|uniref:molybdopterin-binding protein n=1 Tax=Actinotalea ferrariae TaxID=1386098 RepID=UPI001EC9AD8F